MLIRLDRDEKARLTELAEAEGLTLTAFARMRLAGGTATPPRAQALVTSNMSLVRELRRLGGEMKHLLGTRDHVDQARDVLREIAAAVSRASRPVR